MSTVSANTGPSRPAHAQQSQTGSQPAASGLDPVKLILRHKWLLAAATVAGLAVGTVSHFALMYVYPMYKPRAIFECNMPETSPYMLAGTGSISNEEMATFIQTQVRIMTSDEILESVANNPKLEQAAPDWIKKYRNSDGTVDTKEIFKTLTDDVKSKSLPQTRLIELSFSWKKPEDAAGVVKLVMDEYMGRVKKRADDAALERTSLLSKSIDETSKEIDRLKNQRATKIKDKKVESADQRLTEANMRLELIGRQQTEIRNQKQDLETRIKIRQDQLNDPSGVPKIPEEIKNRVSKDPHILELQQQMTAIETELDGLRRRGISPDHRAYKQAETRLQSYKQNFEQFQQEAWMREFESELETLKTGLRSVDAQLSVLDDERVQLATRQTELTTVIGELNDITDKVKTLEYSINQSREKLKELTAVLSLPTSARIVPLQTVIRLPKEPIFPKLIFMIPAGAVLGLGLVGGFVVLREIVDQRIKGPGDIGLIPRARLLGWVADAAEDPAGTGVVETAFRDRPRGVIAENYRQIRSSLLKRMDAAGHKVVLVAGCMPASGATSVATNLALACAASGKNVLLIDANFRRPAVHKVFGTGEEPGLGDVLSGKETLDKSVRELKDMPNLRVLPAGAKTSRAYEALASKQMQAVITEARAKYDCVFIDVSPAVISGDAATLAQQVDASMLVVRSFAEKRGMVARIRGELSEARGEFLGIIVNGVKSAAGGYLKGNIMATHEYHSEPAETKS